MENGSSVLILLLFLTCSAPLSSAGVHTLQRIYGCELYDNGTTRGYDQYSYDGKDFISLDLKTGTWTAAKHKAENFINEWDPDGDKAKHSKDFLQTNCIDQLQKILNYTKETLERKVVHTLQRIYGCERDDDGATKGYDQYSYDGEDFISLDLKTGNWTAAKDKAKNFIKEWDHTGEKAKHSKDFLQTDCIDRLQKVLNYSKETLERKDGGSDGRSDGRSDGGSDGGSDGESGGGSDGESGGGSDGGSGGGLGLWWIAIIVCVIAPIALFFVCWKKKNSDFTRVPVSATERPSEVTSSSTDGPASGEAESEHPVIRLNSLSDSDSESVHSCGSRRRCRAARESSFL